MVGKVWMQVRRLRDFDGICRVFHFNIARLEDNDELLVFLCSWPTPIKFTSGRTLGRIVMTLDVLEVGGCATGAEIER